MKSLRPGLLPVIALVVVIAWALFAVLMLTGTLISTSQIQNRVNAINVIYPRVDQNLKSVPLALQTARISGEIEDAARPVGPQFTDIVKDVQGIQASVTSVQNLVGPINKAVLTINGSVKAINASVVPIGTSLASIDDKVKSINSSVHGINNSFDGILDHVHSIDDRVAGINHRAERIKDIGDDIKDDTGRLVSPLLPDILKNSFAISRSPVINPLDLSRLDLRRLGGIVNLLRNPARAAGLVTMAQKIGLPVPAVDAVTSPLVNPPLVSKTPAQQFFGVLGGGNDSGSHGDSEKAKGGQLPLLGGMLGSGR
jgi:hypothetical protein